MTKDEAQQKPEQQAPADATKIAAYILTYLGFSQDESVQPGADRRRDTVAMMIKNAAPQPAQQEPVTDEENEKFSRDVSGFKGADPEATKYALDEFLRNRVPAIGDIRALKHRIHALEGDVIGYKQLLDAAEQPTQQEPLGKVNELFDESVIEQFGFNRELLVYTSPPAQRKPLTEKQKSEMTFTAKISQEMSPVEIYLQGISDAETAHNIKEQP